ncbi:hypothetical protein DFO53_4590 [Enterobacter sp. AG5470]|nr:hypothetical protein DFO53_4590 [Enterobacter sp. AG5470]
MKDVLVFFNSHPPEVVRTIMAVTTIIRHYADGREEKMRITPWFPATKTGAANQVYIATDRVLSQEEILSAARRLGLLRSAVTGGGMKYQQDARKTNGCFPDCDKRRD